MLDPFAILTHQIHLPIFHHLFISIISWLNNLIWRTIGWNSTEAISTGKNKTRRSFLFANLLITKNQESLNMQFLILLFLLDAKEFSAFLICITYNNMVFIEIDMVQTKIHYLIFNPYFLILLTDSHSQLILKENKNKIVWFEHYNKCVSPANYWYSLYFSFLQW